MKYNHKTICIFHKIKIFLLCDKSSAEVCEMKSPNFDIEDNYTELAGQFLGWRSWSKACMVISGW